MIVRPAPALPPEEAARRVAAGAQPVWVSSPAAGPEAQVARDLFAADPCQVVRGGLTELQAAWQAARARWQSAGVGASVPVGVGWLAYDLARGWLPLGRRSDEWPALEFRFYDAVAIHEASSGQLNVLACDERAAQRLADRLATPAPALAAPVVGAFVSRTSRNDHAAAVRRIQEYLRAGDVYQVNLARRLVAPVTAGDPLWIAAALRARAPAPHAIWMGRRSRAEGPIDAYVVGNSPERFLAVDASGMVETRPIKGTRPRGAPGAPDQALRDALGAAAKDRAEHVMIVDLERNDLGRVCQTGTVTVEDLLRVVALPTVFHLVSTVRGRLRPEVDLQALLHATFPGGSITGAPKRRAMEIIDELEPLPRGLYTGATGWLGANGELDLAVAIRTATVSGGELALSVGGGIVIDSDPAAEWEETEVKARAFRAVCGSEKP